MNAGFAPARLGGAVGASILAHAALLGALGSMPAAPEARQQLASFGERVLTATLMESATTNKNRPEAKPVPPAPLVPALPAPHYHAAEELDERPLILTHVEPRWPGGATPGQGHLRLQLYVGKNGGVDKVEILDSYPSGAFDAAAKEAFAAARYRPGMLGGAPVRSVVQVELLFGTSLPIDPRATRSAEGERPAAANPNAFDAPDRAGIKVRPPRSRPSSKETS